MFTGPGVSSKHGSLRRDSVKSLRRKLRLGVMGGRRREEREESEGRQRDKLYKCECDHM